MCWRTPTALLAASWHSNKSLNPVTDGAVLPILGLNGYKVANPTVLARIPESELVSLMEATGTAPTSWRATGRNWCTSSCRRSACTLGAARRAVLNDFETIGK